MLSKRILISRTGWQPAEACLCSHLSAFFCCVTTRCCAQRSAHCSPPQTIYTWSAKLLPFQICLSYAAPPNRTFFRWGGGNSSLIYEVVHMVHTASPNTRLMLLLNRGDPLPALELLTQDLAGHCYKDEVDESIVHLVRAVAAGATFFSRTMITQLVTPSVPSAWPAFAALTPTEQKLTTLVAQGLTNAKIAVELGWTRQSVRNATSRLYQRLGISRMELIARFPR